MCHRARLRPQAFEDQVEPYAQEMLRAWPDHMRVTPRSWAKALIRGKGFAQIRMCRHLDLSRFVIRSEQLTMLLRSQKHMQDLSVLTLHGVHIDADDLAMLYGHPALSRIEHLNAEFECYLVNRDRAPLTSPVSAPTAQHNAAAMLPLKSMVVNSIAGIGEYLRTPQAQGLSYLKCSHWVHDTRYTLAQAFEDIDLPQLRHFALDLMIYGPEGVDAGERGARGIDRQHRRVRVDVAWALRLSLRNSYGGALLGAHQRPRVDGKPPQPARSRIRQRPQTHARQTNPCTRVHTLDLPRDFSWAHVSCVLTRLRAEHDAPLSPPDQS